MPRCLARQQMVGEYLQKPTTAGKTFKNKFKKFKHIQMPGLGQLTIEGLPKKIKKKTTLMGPKVKSTGNIT